MSISFLISMFARGAIVLALALVAVRLARRAPASMRHAVLVFAAAAVLALPALAAIVPTWHAGAIAAMPAPLAEPPGTPISEGSVAVTPAQTVVATTPPRSVPWTSLVAALWLAGVGFGLARIAIGALRARRLAARGVAVVDANEHIAVAWQALDGRGAPPRIVVSDEIEAPIVVGAIAPVVVVPRSSETWGALRWRVVLLHELAHVRRRDGLANLVARFARCVHWPDPLAWIAAARVRAECELAADDAVLRDGTRASTYAEHLVAIASAAGRTAPAAVLAMTGPSRFEVRLAALLDGGRTRSTIGALRGIAVGACVLAVATTVACMSPEAAPASRAPAASGPALVAKDPALQAAAEAELDRAMSAHGASGAIAIVLDAKTGAPLALAARGNGDVLAARLPGSTMKPFTFAAALEAGVVAPDTRVDCEGGAKWYGDKQLHDAAPNTSLDLGGVLAVSSNVCTAKIAEPLGDRLGEALRRYHFAAPARVDTHTFGGAAVAVGEGVKASALDVAAGYTAIADDGTYHAPDGSSERVMSAATALALKTMLARVVDDANGTGHAARIDGVRVAGKTGTAQSGSADRYYASFVGIVPADAPRFVVLVGVDGVTRSGGEVAAPVFATIAARALGR